MALSAFSQDSSISPAFTLTLFVKDVFFGNILNVFVTVPIYAPFPLTDKKTNTVSYEYDVQNGWYQTFHIKFENPDNLASIKKVKCTLNKNTYTYDGKAKKPAVTVTLKGKKLRQGTDYTVKYKNNKKSGIPSYV